MSASLRQVNLSAVTAELLRVAESGDVDELLRLLPRVVDINARNRHGMSALMKAAFFGHEPVVRVLLEHGADPNLMRNDSFTALALAAFFGHGATVRTLIEFGARTEAVTRAGASARAWARARTYEDVARCLETHEPKKPVPIAIAPTPAPAPAPVAFAPLEVKTLKDPPEIWDLVHEVPRTFNPRSAFISRLTSSRKTLALSLCAVMLLIAGGVVGLLTWRNSRRLRPVPPAPLQVVAETTVSKPPEPQPVVETPPVEVVNANHASAIPNKARLQIRQPRFAPVVNEPPPESVAVREAPPVATPQFVPPKPSPPAATPQVITPTKPKGKVIQWP